MRALPLALAALTLTAPAVAQDGSETAEKRTVEGAQKFLSEYYSQTSARLKSGGYTLNGHWSIEKLPGSTHEMAEGTIVKFEPVDRCKSKFIMSPAIKYRWRASDPRVPITADSGRLVVDVDWSKITRLEVKDDWYFEEGGPNSVSTGSTMILIWMKKATEGGDASFFPIHATKEEAERAAFAMQFLKEQCGFKTETGF